MAQKRMFDRDIVSRDDFIEMSSDAQSLYFHLGIQADDEGFVSPKGIMRMISAPEDALKLLIAKNFVIKFRSGVVVITDWENNNWLDSRRVRKTPYQDEKKLLSLNGNNQYVLSIGSAPAKHPLREYSIEENRIEESSLEERVTPSEETKSFFEEKSPYSELLELFSKDKDRGLIESEFKKFTLYWTEPNGSGTKQRWQQQPTFDVKRRLFTWLSKINQYKTTKKERIVL